MTRRTLISIIAAAASATAISGAGIAGCALAHQLGKHGVRVTVVERRHRQPARVSAACSSPLGSSCSSVAER